MDPYWVIFDIIGVVAPPELNAAIAAYPLPGGNVPPLNSGLNNCPYYIPFGTFGDARHFAGYIQGACGIHCWVSSNSTNPPV